jgi:hypothetical protein
MRISRATNWLVALIGVWQIITPFVLNFYSDYRTALWYDEVTGVVFLVLGLGIVFAKNLKTNLSTSWFAFLVGLVTIASPFFLNFSSEPRLMLNNIVAGAVVAALELASAFASGGLLSSQRTNEPQT